MMMAVAHSSKVFAPCDERRYLNINAELRVNGASSATATSFIVMEQASGFRFKLARYPRRQRTRRSRSPVGGKPTAHSAMFNKLR